RLTARSDASRDLRIEAIQLLGRSREEQALPRLINALRESDAEERAGAAAALMQLADARAIEPLVTMLKDPHPGVGIFEHRHQWFDGSRVSQLHQGRCGAGALLRIGLSQRVDEPRQRLLLARASQELNRLNAQVSAGI